MLSLVSCCLSRVQLGARLYITSPSVLHCKPLTTVGSSLRCELSCSCSILLGSRGELSLQAANGESYKIVSLNAHRYTDLKGPYFNSTTRFSRHMRFNLIGKYYRGLKQTAAGHAMLSANSSKIVLLSIAWETLNVSDISKLVKWQTQ